MTNPYDYTQVIPQPLATRRPQARRRTVPWLLIIALAVAAMFMLTTIVGVVFMIATTPEKLPAGVTVAGQAYGSQPVDEAETALTAQLADTSLTVTDGDRNWPLTLADLGVTVDVDATLAVLRTAQANTNLMPVYEVDLNQAQIGLIALSEQVNIDAVAGDPPQYGRSMEIPVMLDRLRLDAAGELSDGVFELNMIETEPPQAEAAPSYSGATTTHVVEAGQELALIARQYGVSVEDIVALNGITNPDLLYVGQSLTIPAAGAYVPENVPPAPSAEGRSILVSIADQRIYAYENGQLVRTHLTSTGRSETPTVLGDYRIYVKYEADDMSGPDYFLPQVPYTMYFYQGYAIHGTYWHNSFGRPMSHGCVNLPVAEAEWFFNFASVGTLVRVV
jgi:lipoprotein-anchoring transpeptidase ErfK/SrfK